MKDPLNGRRDQHIDVQTEDGVSFNELGVGITFEKPVLIHPFADSSYVKTVSVVNGA